MLPIQKFSSFSQLAPLYNQNLNFISATQPRYVTSQTCSLSSQRFRKSSSQSSFLNSQLNQSKPQILTENTFRTAFAYPMKSQKSNSVSQQSRFRNRISTFGEYANQLSKQYKKAEQILYPKMPFLDYAQSNRTYQQFDDKQNKGKSINMSNADNTIKQKQRSNLQPPILLDINSSKQSLKSQHESFGVPNQQKSNYLDHNNLRLSESTLTILNKALEQEKDRLNQAYNQRHEQIATFYKQKLIGIKNQYEDLIERIVCQNDQKQRNFTLQLRAKERQSAQLQYQLDCQNQVIEYFKQEMGRSKRASSCSNLKRVIPKQTQSESKMISWTQHKQEISKISRLYRGQLEDVKAFYKKQVKELRKKITRQSQPRIGESKKPQRQNSSLQIKTLCDQIISDTIKKIYSFEQRVLKNFQQEQTKLNSIKERIKQLTSPKMRKSVSVSNLDITPSFNECKQLSFNSNSMLNKNSKEESLLIEISNREYLTRAWEDKSVQTDKNILDFNQNCNSNQRSQFSKIDENLLDSFKPSIIQFENTPKPVKNIRDVSDADSLIYSQALSFYQQKQNSKIDQEDFLSQINRVMGGTETKIRKRND